MSDGAAQFHRASTAPANDYTIPQDWESYTEEEHNTWNVLYERLMKVLPGRADDAFIHGLT
ncbi:MAG: phenylalanine 4-monooxygenase, partial [Pseudomonadota bacterium]